MLQLRDEVVALLFQLEDDERLRRARRGRRRPAPRAGWGGWGRRGGRDGDVNVDMDIDVIVMNKIAILQIFAKMNLKQFSY